MSAFKSQQRHLEIQGRTFHFVSYEGQPANVRRNEEAQPPMWYLMVAGRRFAAFPCDATQDLEQVDRALLAWAEANAVGPALEEAPVSTKGQTNKLEKRGNWWGPG